MGCSAVAIASPLVSIVRPMPVCLSYICDNSAPDVTRGGAQDGPRTPLLIPPLLRERVGVRAYRPRRYRLAGLDPVPTVGRPGGRCVYSRPSPGWDHVGATRESPVVGRGPARKMQLPASPASTRHTPRRTGDTRYPRWGAGVDPLATTVSTCARSPITTPP